MYVPSAFAIEDRAWALDLASRWPFGLLVTSEGTEPTISHLPMLVEERAGALWVFGHVSAANAHAESIRRGTPATVVFSGAHAYVSASWYEQPYETVPTWNYETLHLRGMLRSTDADAVVAALTEAFETGRPDPWDYRRLDPAFAQGQLRGIVAFEMRADGIAAKAKLSQNRTPADRTRVHEALARSDDPADRACADAMERAEKRR